jgi:hypothetical protein
LVSSIIFEGLESVTDLAFYLLYKYYKHSPMWSIIEYVTLDSCRYVTDFGLELLSHATNKPSLTSNSTTNGCSSLFKYKYHSVQLDRGYKDLFSCPIFTKLAIDQAEAASLDSYKVVVINETRLDVVSLLEPAKKRAKQSDTKKLFSFCQISLPKNHEHSGPVVPKEQFVLNVFEVDSVLKKKNKYNVVVI